MTSVIAHGRIAEHVPGPALAAFDAILAIGVDMLEFDVRRTSDGVLVVAHDDVSARTQAELGPAFPAVHELLELTRGRVAVDVELKEPGCAAGALELARAAHTPAEILVTAFDPALVREAAAADPEVRLGYIVEDPAAVRALTGLAVDYLVPRLSLIRAGVLDGLTVPALVWGVNHEPDMRQMLDDSRVGGIITDEPELALRLRAASRSR